MANLTLNTPSPSPDMPREEREIWEHIHELENQLRNILDNLDGNNFTDDGIAELKRRLGI